MTTIYKRRPVNIQTEAVDRQFVDGSGGDSALPIEIYGQGRRCQCNAASPVWTVRMVRTGVSWFSPTGAT